MSETNAMLSRLGVVYGAPRPDADEAKKFFGEYARILRQYTESELNAAADKLLSERKYKTWPTIADCVAACEAVRMAIRSRMAAEQNRERARLVREPKQMSPEERAEAEAFVDGVADGSIELFAEQIARQEAQESARVWRGEPRTIGAVVDFGLLARRLRQMARTMRAKRRGSA